MYLDVSAVELTANRGDTKWHFPGKQGQDRVLGFPAVSLDLGIEDPHLGTIRCPTIHETQQAVETAVDVLRGPVAQVLRRKTAVKRFRQGVQVFTMIGVTALFGSDSGKTGSASTSSKVPP